MTSTDILFIVLTVCAVALTTVLVWFLIELIRIARGIARTMSVIESKLTLVDELTRVVREKIHDATTAVSALVKVVAGVVRFLQGKRSGKKKTSDADDEF